eukprot:scaffold171798_cov19-Cyclotella_meneghiniana.AAC.1
MPKCIVEPTTKAPASLSNTMAIGRPPHCEIQAESHRRLRFLSFTFNCRQSYSRRYQHCLHVYHAVSQFRLLQSSTSWLSQLFSRICKSDHQTGGDGRKGDTECRRQWHLGDQEGHSRFSCIVRLPARFSSPAAEKDTSDSRMGWDILLVV